MQTKSVLTVLSLTMLFSSSAFGVFLDDPEYTAKLATLKKRAADQLAATQRAAAQLATLERRATAQLATLAQLAAAQDTPTETDDPTSISTRDWEKLKRQHDETLISKEAFRSCVLRSLCPGMCVGVSLGLWLLLRSTN